VAPTILDFVNFSDSNPFLLGDSAGYYQYYKEDVYGLIANNTFTANSTSSLMVASVAQWPVPACGEIAASARLAFANVPVNGTIKSPLGITSDPFYGAGWFGLVDDQYGWKLMVVLTNSTVFAWYQRFTTDLGLSEQSQTFAYMVPIASRQNQPDALSYAFYSIVFNAAKRTVSYRVNGAEKLLINAAGLPIDNRFLVGDAAGLEPGSLPAYFQLLLGVGIPDVSGVPFTACQGALFSQCRQSIRNAYATYCQYYPKQSPDTFLNQMALYVENFGIAEWQLQGDCAVDALGRCRQAALDGFCCPDAGIPCCRKEEPWPKEPCCPQGRRQRRLQQYRYGGKYVL
jgi:hypothetical protein